MVVFRSFILALAALLPARAAWASPADTEQRCPPAKCRIEVRVTRAGEGCTVGVDFDTFRVVGQRPVTWEIRKEADDPNAYVFASPGVRWLAGPNGESTPSANRSANQDFEAVTFSDRSISKTGLNPTHGHDRDRDRDRYRHRTQNRYRGKLHYYDLVVVIESSGRQCDAADPRIANDGG